MISNVQSRILCYVSENPNCQLVEIAKNCNTTCVYASHVLWELGALGLVKRHKRERFVYFEPTEKGKKVADHLREIMNIMGWE